MLKAIRAGAMTLVMTVGGVVTAGHVGVAVRLRSGAVLTLPADAISAGEYNRVDLGAAGRVYKSKSSAVPLIVIYELDRKGKTCKELVAEMWTTVQQQAKSTAPADKALTRVDKIEKRSVRGALALYSETANRAPSDVVAHRPFHAAASYLICSDSDYFNLIVSADDPILPGAARQEIDALVATLSIPAK